MKISDAPPAGWYPDPEGGSRLRWWEGTDWSDRYRSRPVEARYVAPLPDPTKLQTGQWVPQNLPHVPSAPIDTQAVVEQVRTAAREEAARAAAMFGQEARSAARAFTPLVTEYTTKVARWFRFLAVLAVLLLIGWLAFQLFAEASLFEWIGDRIDHLTDRTTTGLVVRR